MKTGVIIVVFVAFSAVASASTFYRCQVDGRTVISNIPCAGPTIETREIQTSPAAPPPTVEQQRNIAPTRQTAPAPTPAARKPATIKAYEITHRATERSGTVEVSGRLTGPQCNSLRVDAFARTSDGGIINCVTVTRLTGISTVFSCSDTTRRARDGRNREWFVSTIRARCQD